MMWELVEQTWSLAGRAIPAYSRSEMPSRVIRPEPKDLADLEILQKRRDP